MSFIKTLYTTTFRRTSTFFLVIMGGTFVFERIFNQGADQLYEKINRGKLWMHIRDNYEKKE